MSYTKFINLVRAIRSTPNFPAMDAVEEQILNAFASAWALGRQVTVMEAMEMVPDISGSTVHRRLKTLRDKGLIELDIDAIDNRVKYVVATSLAKKYFAKLDECLVKARE